MTLDLFPDQDPTGSGAGAPLADRMRPRRLGEVIGQQQLLGPGRPLRTALDSGRLGSMILWGPPGSGKTTLARLLARSTGLRFLAYSAVTSGVAEIRKVVAAAREERRRSARATLLFVDEIHRFNKAQQDAFLPHVESGLITLIGATTENPSFEVNAALQSRVQVHVLRPLARDELRQVLEQALADRERGLGELEVDAEPAALDEIAELAGGDARVALNLLEAAAAAASGRPPRIQPGLVRAVAGRPAVRHDRAGESHYDLISALIKSVRGSDADGALYWLARLIEGGEEPLFVARRLLILAAEDVGNADPQALPLAVAAYQATHAIGMPEAALVLSQATIYLAAAPKSNSALESLVRARADARRSGAAPVPLHLRNAPTRLMQELGFGRGYRYAHHEDDREQTYLPPELVGRTYYQPGHGAGCEREVARRIEARRRRRSGKPPAAVPGARPAGHDSERGAGRQD